MSNVINLKKENEQEIKKVYNSLSQRTLDSFAIRANKDTKQIAKENNLSCDILEDITFAIYRAYIIGAVIEKSNKDDITFNFQNNKKMLKSKKKFIKTNIPNVIKLITN